MFDVAALQSMSQLQNIFGPPKPQDPFGSMGLMNPQPPQFDMRTRMDELYKPSMTMQDRFNSHLDTMPQLGDYQPSGLRRLGAILYGMGQKDPFGAAMQFTQMPYLQQLEQWKMPLNSLQQAADNERLMNSQNRQWAQNVTSQEMAQQRIDETNRANLAREADRERLRERQDRMQRLREMMHANPNMQMREVNGRAYAFDPATGQMIDTGIAGMTDFEKASFSANAAMSRVQVQQQGANDRTAMTQQGAMERDTNNWLPFTKTNPDGTQESVLINPTTGAERPMGGQFNRMGTQPNVLTRPIQPAAQARALVNKATQIKNTNPDLGRWININGLTVTVAPASGGGLFGGRGPTPEQRSQIMAELYGNNQVAPGTKVRVKSPDGAQTGTIDASELAAALAAGWIKVE